MCERAPRQKAAESRKIPESGSVIPREGVESSETSAITSGQSLNVIPREGVERVEEPQSLGALREGRVIPREGVESVILSVPPVNIHLCVIPREGVESSITAIVSRSSVV